MPNNLIQSFAKRTGLSIPEVESKWQSAKKYVKDHLNKRPSQGGDFYKAVVGTMKWWFRDKLKKEDIQEIDKEFREILNEVTTTGDVAKYEPEMMLQRRRESKIPDGTTHDGLPYFIIDDDVIVSKILDGRKKHERWQNLVPDKGIHDWANQNFLKGFYVKTKHGALLKMR